MDISTCILCDKKLSFWNQPVFGKGKLKTEEKVCSSCFMKINNKSPLWPLSFINCDRSSLSAATGKGGQTIFLGKLPDFE